MVEPEQIQIWIVDRSTASRSGIAEGTWETGASHAALPDHYVRVMEAVRSDMKTSGEPGAQATSRRGHAIVGIATDARVVGEQRLFTTEATVAEAIARVTGALPLLIPALGKELDTAALLEHVHGLVMQGGISNVCPSQYGVRPTEAYGPFDPARDATTLPLIRAALVKGVPLLMICRGFQELNVALGGTLTVEADDLPEEEKHGTPESASSEDERFRLRQDLDVAQGGQLSKILDADRIVVNSLHSQKVDELAPGLRVEGRAPDGSVEAVTVRGAKGFALGVVFHPEYWAEQDGPSYRILCAFADAVESYAAGRPALQAAE